MAALDVLVPETIALAWSFEPAVVVPVVAAAALYLRGWAALRPRMPERFGAGRAAAFAAGLGVVLLALCSPIDALGHRLAPGAHGPAPAADGGGAPAALAGRAGGAAARRAAAVARGAR